MNTDVLKIECCPACGTDDVYARRFSSIGRPAEGDERYRCRRCSERFDTPDERPIAELV